jgi:hypothetical protein
MDGAELRPAHAVVNYRKPGHERADHDWSVDVLLATERFVGSVWDPACGEGNIVAAAAARGHEAFGTDIVDRGFGSRLDFLGDGAARMPPVDNIICNPPFKLAEDFIERALGIARLKVAMLVRLAFLEGSRRHERLFANRPPARALVFRSRVSMPPGGKGIEAKGGAVAFQWLVWRHDHSGATELGWL